MSDRQEFPFEVALHEAAHAVVSNRCGGETLGLVVWPQRRMGSTPFFWPSSRENQAAKREDPEGYRDNALVSIAGLISEHFHGGGTAENFLSLLAAFRRGDTRPEVGFIAFSRPDVDRFDCSAKEVNIPDADLVRECWKLVMENWEHIKEIAVRLQVMWNFRHFAVAMSPDDYQEADGGYIDPRGNRDAVVPPASDRRHSTPGDSRHEVESEPPAPFNRQKETRSE